MKSSWDLGAGLLSPSTFRSQLCLTDSAFAINVLYLRVCTEEEVPRRLPASSTPPALKLGPVLDMFHGGSSSTNAELGATRPVSS